jgi:hypothetical protein
MIAEINKKYDDEIDFYTKMSEIAQNSQKSQDGENSKIVVLRWYKLNKSAKAKRNTQILESLDGSSKTPNVGPEFTPVVLDSTAAIAYIFNLALQNQGIGMTGTNKSPITQSPTQNINYTKIQTPTTLKKKISEDVR